VKRTGDVAIVGAGPAGIASALQLKRFGINPLLFEKSRIGGLLNNAYCVENYPGFPKGISGPALVKKFKQHLKKWKINIIKEHVVSITRYRGNFILHAKRNYTTKFLVVSSGTKPKYPEFDLNGLGKRIFFEVYPLRKKKNKKIIIVGAGDAAFDYALNLGRNNKIIIFNRDKKIKGLTLLFQRIQQSFYRKNITYMSNMNILTIEQLNNCSIVKVSNRGKEKFLVCDYVIFAIGREPATDFLPLTLRRKFPDGDKNVYFIGDVKHGNLRQTGIAIGDGIHTAMKIHQYLKTEKTRSV
jgi:thioredoxin reductase (NADPH)